MKAKLFCDIEQYNELDPETYSNFVEVECGADGNWILSDDCAFGII